jgi:hypothetical protein
MAVWKKVVVSGSNISQLNNDAGYLTAGTLGVPNGFSTASFNGTNLLADSPTGSLSFASSSGQGLTISANSGTDTLTFGLSDIPNATLTNSSITIAGTSVSLGGSITQAQILNGSGVWSGSAQLPAGIVSSSVLSSPAQGQAVLTTNGVAGSTVDLGLETGDSPQFVGLKLTGDAAVNGGDITTTAATATVFNTNATTVNAFGAATTLNLGAGSGTTTVNNSLVVTGDLTVNGTTTFINVQDLYVEDKFILLASGSAASSDGGIIIDRGSDAAGNIAYGFDAATDRWGFQSGVTDTTNALDPTSAGGVSGSFVPYLFTEANHGATKPVTGEFAVQGAMYTSTAGDIWIYA